MQYNFPYQGDARSMKQILASNGYHHWNFPETQPTFYESVFLRMISYLTSVSSGASLRPSSYVALLKSHMVVSHCTQQA